MVDSTRTRIYLFSIQEFQYFFQSWLEPYIGPSSMSNDYTDLIIYLFQFTLDQATAMNRLAFIDSVLAYGLTQLDAETTFSEGLNLVVNTIRRTMNGPISEYDYLLESYNQTTLKIVQYLSERKTISKTQQTLYDLEYRIQEEINNGCWLSERERRLYEALLDRQPGYLAVST